MRPTFERKERSASQSSLPPITWESLPAERRSRAALKRSFPTMQCIVPDERILPFQSQKHCEIIKCHHFQYIGYISILLPCSLLSFSSWAICDRGIIAGYGWSCSLGFQQSSLFTIVVIPVFLAVLAASSIPLDGAFGAGILWWRGGYIFWVVRDKT